MPQRAAMLAFVADAFSLPVAKWRHLTGRVIAAVLREPLIDQSEVSYYQRYGTDCGCLLCSLRDRFGAACGLSKFFCRFFFLIGERNLKIGRGVKKIGYLPKIGQFGPLQFPPKAESFHQPLISVTSANSSPEQSK